MKNVIRLIILQSLVAMLIASCSNSDMVKNTSELILFAVVGDQPYQDHIFSINPDGSGLKMILVGKPGRSYQFASSVYLHDNLIVKVHEAEKSNIEDRLYIYSPHSSQMKRLLSAMDGIVGYGVMSPDLSQIAFTYAQKAKPWQYRLWVTNLKTEKTRQLSGEREEDTWDNFPSWHPNSQEIFFIRFHRDNEGLRSKLMRAELDGDIPPVIVMDEDVAGACLAPDGRRLAAWTKEGLEIIENQPQRRKIILPANSVLPNYRYRGGWLSWSQNQDKIVFSVLNAQIKQDELWIISSDGGSPLSIYNQKSGTIIGPIFTKLDFIHSRPLK